MPRLRSLPVPTAGRLPSAAETLGLPPLIPGDDRTGYDALLASIAAAVHPADPLEQAWVRDVVDLIWEAVRLRRLKAALLTTCAGDGMQQVLFGVDVRAAISGLHRRWAARELAAVDEADRILDAAGLGIDHVMAQTLRLRIAEIERIDRMVASAEARRAATLREIAGYRHELAARLRHAATAAIEDAEFEVVEAAGATGSPSAAAEDAQHPAEAAE